MTDLVERLRNHDALYRDDTDKILIEAADRIAELEEDLRKANKKFDVLLSCALSATAPDDAYQHYVQ